MNIENLNLEKDKTIKVLFKRGMIYRTYTLNNGSLVISFNEIKPDDLDIIIANIEIHLGLTVKAISDRSILVESKGYKTYFSDYGEEYQQLYIIKSNILIFK